MRKAILILFFLVPQISLAYSTDYRFTGQPYDGASDLYYFNQRYYNPNLGRFTQPDPLQNYLVTPQLQPRSGLSLEEVLANPQRFNSYSYSLNNPVNVVDPTGESATVSPERQERFNQVSNYIRNDESYWLVRDRDGNAAAVDLLWQKSLELSKNEKDEINVGKALDTFYDSVNVNWRDDKTLDQSREDYLDRLYNLPNALTGQYGGDLSQIDKLQHFAASARLAHKLGPKMAMLLGRLKEFKDGLRSFFGGKKNYQQNKQTDDGYSVGDISANQQGVFWYNQYINGGVNPSTVFNNL
ncbi:MAG: RHS repeat-associated core domain-containing protein [Candidatus Komeilibacteria bacterium]|nr:RHS repeat-associated core domain-containing protein [Candidatus Komeilibacteria bacterium]